MAGPTIIIGSLINLIVIDFLARLLARSTREVKYFKPAGLVALFTLALSQGLILLPHRTLAIKRFVLSATVAFGLGTAIMVVLNNNPFDENNLSLVLSSLALLIAMPFYYIIFGLFGSQPLALMASINTFRLRGVLALIVGANLSFALLSQSKNPLVLATFAVCAFIAVVNLLYLLSHQRSKIGFFALDQEDSDGGPVAFFHYLCGVMEFFFYCALMHEALLGRLFTTLVPTTSVLWLSLLSFALVYGASFLLAKLFMAQRSALSLNFYERGLLPISFLFFGIAFVVEHHW